MRQMIFFLLLALISSCGNNATDTEPIVDLDTPTVRTSSTFEVISETDVVYAEGLSHETLNSQEAQVIPLTLDIYYPDNTDTNRPVFMFIHGGGFKGGSKTGGTALRLADYYTSRGWVFVSIKYRLQAALGTIPQEWIDYPGNTPANLLDQYYAIYPAQRDAKAAMRWLVANADTYSINTEFITVSGGSAGAITAITLGISEPEDFRDEIPLSQDPTLNSTNRVQSFNIKTIVDFWGSDVALDLYEEVFGPNRFDANDPPLFIAHGTEDQTVLFSDAEELKAEYDRYQIPIAYYPLEGWGHGAWNATVNGKRLEELAFDFIVEQQGLNVN